MLLATDMYVCICNAVTDREIRQCVALGAQTFEQVRDCLGVSTCCGRCEPIAREIVVEREARAGSAVPA